MNNKKLSTTSLNQFIATQLNLSLIVIAIFWGILSIYSYNFALDDTSEFYLVEDAENTAFLISEGLEHDMLNTDFKQVYLSFSALPSDIKNKIASLPLATNQTLFLATPEHDIYLLAFSQSDNTKADFFIVHRFNKQATFNVSYYFIFFASLALLVLALVVNRVTYRVSSQTKLMSKKINNLTKDKQHDNDEFIFTDFSATYDVIEKHYLGEKHALQREKEFASFLSHEIRQPLAKMNNNLALLDQVDELPLGSLAILADMKLTNSQLSLLSTEILQLWQTSISETEQFDVSEVVNSQLKLMQLAGLKLTILLPTEPVKVNANKALVTLMVKQLLQNAQQYANQYLTIELTAQQLKLSNDIKLTQDDHAELAASEFGFGIGLILVDKSCKVLDWHWQHHESKQQFSVWVDMGLC